MDGEVVGTFLSIDGMCHLDVGFLWMDGEHRLVGGRGCRLMDEGIPRVFGSCQLGV